MTDSCSTCGARGQLEEDVDNRGSYYCAPCWEAHDAAEIAAGRRGRVECVDLTLDIQGDSQENLTFGSQSESQDPDFLAALAASKASPLQRRESQDPDFLAAMAASKASPLHRRESQDPDFLAAMAASKALRLHRRESQDPDYLTALAASSADTMAAACEAAAAAQAAAGGATGAPEPPVLRREVRLQAEVAELAREASTLRYLEQRYGLGVRWLGEMRHGGGSHGAANGNGKGNCAADSGGGGAGEGAGPVLVVEGPCHDAVAVAAADLAGLAPAELRGGLRRVRERQTRVYVDASNILVDAPPGFSVARLVERVEGCRSVASRFVGGSEDSGGGGGGGGRPPAASASIVPPAFEAFRARGYEVVVQQRAAGQREQFVDELILAQVRRSRVPLAYPVRRPRPISELLTHRDTALHFVPRVRRRHR